MSLPSAEMILEQGLERLGIGQPGLSACLLRYLGLLEKWNRTYNLTSVRDRHHIVSVHFLDSLSIKPHLPESEMADAGSGAGFPGLPLALAEPDQPWTLIEPSEKRSAFLRQVCGELAIANVKTIGLRSEDYQVTPGFSGVVSRAFASLAEFAVRCRHLLAPGGRLYAMKGSRPDDEIAALPEGVRCERVLRIEVPFLDAERHLVVLCPGA